MSPLCRTSPRPARQLRFQGVLAHLLPLRIISCTAPCRDSGTSKGIWTCPRIRQHNGTLPEPKPSQRFGRRPILGVSSGIRTPGGDRGGRNLAPAAVAADLDVPEQAEPPEAASAVLLRRGGGQHHQGGRARLRHPAVRLAAGARAGAGAPGRSVRAQGPAYRPSPRPAGISTRSPCPWWRAWTICTRRSHERFSHAISGEVRIAAGPSAAGLPPAPIPHAVP